MQTLGSVFEGVEDGAVDVCLNVSGRIVEERNYTVTVFGVNEGARIRTIWDYSTGYYNFVQYSVIE